MELGPNTLTLLTQIDLTGFAHFAVEAFHDNTPPQYIYIHDETHLHQRGGGEGVWSLVSKGKRVKCISVGKAPGPRTR